MFDINTYKADFRTKHILELSESEKMEVSKVDLSIFDSIPYFLGEQSFAFSDCWGLARMFYAVHGWQFDIDEGHTYEHKETALLHVVRYVRQNFHRTNISDVEYGDLLLFGFHVFVYLGQEQDGRTKVIGQSPLNTEILTAGGIYYIDIKEMELFCGGWPVEVWRRNKAKLCIPYKLTDNDRAVIQLNKQDNPYKSKKQRFRGEETYGTYVRAENFLQFRGYSPDVAKTWVQRKQEIDGGLAYKVAQLGGLIQLNDMEGRMERIGKVLQKML